MRVPILSARPLGCKPGSGLANIRDIVMTSQTAATPRYSQMLILLHWVTFLLIVGAYAAIELREFFPKGSATRDAMKAWHFTFGLTILALVAFRIAVRFLTPTPPISPPLTGLQQLGAKLGHVALYLLMIGMPIGGWLILSGEAKPIPFWFGVELPALMPANKDLAELIEEVHGTFGKIGYFLIGLHAAAALFHHYIRRDTTLLRMMPGKRA